MTDDLMKRANAACGEDGGPELVDLINDLVERIEQLQAQNMKLSGMVYDLKKEVAISDALLIGEAEASLERLARTEKAEAERDALEQDNHRWKMECENFWRDREKALTTDNSRLREALQQFLMEYDVVDLADAETSSMTAAVLASRDALKRDLTK